MPNRRVAPRWTETGMQQIKIRLLEYDDSYGKAKAVFMALTALQYDDLLEDFGPALVRNADKIIHRVDSGVVTDEDFDKARAAFRSLYPGPAAAQE